MRDVRWIAYDLLLDWEFNKTFPNLALKKALRNVADQRDRRFITALVYGVIERKITLDYFIAKCSDRDPKEMDAKLLIALRMGIYQMFYMDIPAAAACNTSVELLKTARFFKGTGFCNAVLRRCSDRREELLLLKKADFSVRYSIDPALVELLLEQYGKETFVEMMGGLQKNNNDIYLYRNVSKGTQAEFITALNQCGLDPILTDLPDLYKIDHGFSIESSAAYQNGWFHVVGYHSAQAALLCPKEAKDIMDLCAAPGGKTFILAADPKRKVRAFDIHPHKIDHFNQEAKRLGLHNVISALRNGAEFVEKDVESADFVLCDVPCSGLGMMGKKPDIKYKQYISSEFTDLQVKILENGLRYLKPGGKLVYSTCTIDQRENSLLVQAFLKKNPQYQLEREQIDLPLDGNDGFYIALIKKG